MSTLNSKVSYSLKIPHPLLLIMSLHVENVDEKMVDGGIPLPKVVHSLLIEKYFDHASSAAVAESGAFDGFSPVYKTSRLSQTNYLALHLI